MTRVSERESVTVREKKDCTTRETTLVRAMTTVLRAWQR